MFGRFATAYRLLGEGGMDAVRQAASRRCRSVVHTALGRWVELRGNRVRVSGVQLFIGMLGHSARDKGRGFLGEIAWERAEAEAVRAHLHRDFPVIELGGCTGLISCLINRRLRDPRRHVVVAPNPDTVVALREARRLNHREFRILQCAVAYDSPQVTLSLGSSPLSASVHRELGDRDVVVPARSLSTIAGASGFERFSLVMDAEGAEYDLFQNEERLLSTRVPLVIAELHSLPTDLRDEGWARERLLGLGFEHVGSIDRTHIFRNLRSEVRAGGA